MKKEAGVKKEDEDETSKRIVSQIGELQKFGDNYAKRIEKEKKKLDDLNSKIKDVQEKIEE
jgi:hypothetical protein